MSDVTFRNNSGTSLTLIVPDGLQDIFPTGNVRTYSNFGKYRVKDGPDPVFSFTYTKGSASTELTGNSVGGSVTFNNQSGSLLNVVLPEGSETQRNGSVKVHTDVGMYKVCDAGGYSILSFKYHKGTATVNIYSTDSDEDAATGSSKP